MIDLYRLSVSPGIDAMSCASCIAVGSSASGSTTRLTSPQASAVCGVEKIACQRKFLGAIDADDARQSLRQAPAGHDADARMRVGEARLCRGDQHVAGERQFEPAGDRDAVDRADHGLPALQDRGDRIGCSVGGVCRAHRVRRAAEFLEVEPGREGAAGAGQDEDADTVVGRELADGFVEVRRKSRDSAFIASGRFSVTTATAPVFSINNMFPPDVRDCNFAQALGAAKFECNHGDARGATTVEREKTA